MSRELSGVTKSRPVSRRVAAGKRLSRRRFVAAGCLAAWMAPRCVYSQAQSSQAEDSLFTSAVQQAVKRGLDFLRLRQLDDGSLDLAGAGSADPVAVTALAGMAMLASGSTPGLGPYGVPLDQCVAYLLRRTNAQGFINTPGGNRPMYGHGFATLFLAEVYGMADHPMLRSRLAAAVQLIVNSQNGQGGWRYQPRPLDADVSVTAAQLIALRAARNAGLRVPPETVQRAVAYLMETQNPDGGFRYMLSEGPSEFPRSAAVVMALASAGMQNSPPVARGLEYLDVFLPQRVGSGAAGPLDSPPSSYFFYGHYYAAQAMWQAPAASWQRWYTVLRDLLLATQRPDGSWASIISPEYATAMACFALLIPYNGVPVLQR